MKSTPEMRARIRELMSPEQDQYDLAVAYVLDDLDELIATNARSSEQAGDMVDKATAWDACIKAREEEREQRIKAEQDCEHWAKNYDEQGQSLIKWMDRALGAEARLREYEKLGTVEALRMFLTGLATGRVTTIADVVSSPVGGDK